MHLAHHTTFILVTYLVNYFNNHWSTKVPVTFVILQLSLENRVREFCFLTAILLNVSHLTAHFFAASPSVKCLIIRRNAFHWLFHLTGEGQI